MQQIELTSRDIAAVCRKVATHAETMSGNCGMFAWALSGVLGRRQSKIVMLWNQVDEDGGIMKEGVCDHVLVYHKGYYYDGYGRYVNERQILERWEKVMYKTRSGWPRPEFSYHPASRDTYRIIKEETGWMAYPSLFDEEIQMALVDVNPGGRFVQRRSNARLAV